VFTIQYMLDKLPPGDEVARDFVTAMVQKILEHYTDESAKGGDQRNNTTLEEKGKEKFEGKDDQTMASHLLNGIFPTLRLLSIIEQQQLGTYYTDTQRRIYILAYLTHDVDKCMMHDAVLQGATEVEQVSTWDRAHIERAKELVHNYLQRLDAHNFFPDYEAYLEEITYLVVNTQRQWHTHVHTYLWQFRLRERMVLPLRELCTYSDVMAYLIKHPSDILLSKETHTLRETIQQQSSYQLEFCYHQLREVRGLLTNVVNTGLIRLITDNPTQEGIQQEGIWPYLFFSDGVVYIKRKDRAIALTNKDMVDAVHAQLQRSCANVIKQNAPGFKFSIQGIAKHPGYYFEFLTFEDYVALLKTCVIERTQRDTFSETWTKLQHMQAQGDIPATLSFQTQPDGRTAGIFTRFLSIAFVTLLGLLDPTQQTQQKLHEQTEQAIIEELALQSYWEQSKSIPNRGGVEYRWFWLAAWFLHDHPGLNISGEEQSLEAVFTRVCQRIVQMIGPVVSTQLPQHYLRHLSSYLSSLVELPRSIQATEQLPNFTAEFERYEHAKSKKRKLLCTLCNSAYPTEEQADSTVLFQPWVYKNKLSLYAGKNAGGICALCSLELMLRQILLKSRIRVTGSKFEAQQAKYITVYPNFFFTPETGSLVSNVLSQLRNINFFTVRKHIGEKRLTVAELFQLDVFAAPPSTQGEVVSINYDDEDDENEEHEQDKQKETSNDYSYIKYQPEEYPGLFLFGMRAGKDDNETASWAMPAFLTMALPLVTSTKVVISEMPHPLFASGEDFRETVVFDAPHPYLDAVLQQKRIRVNNLVRTLERLFYVYRINIDTYANKSKPEWGHLSAIARDMETDPLYLFSYLRRQDRINAAYRSSIALYLRIYETFITEATLKESRIAQCVDHYAVFYRGGYQSHSILKPVDIVARAIINSPLNIHEEDLHLQIRGELTNWLDRVRSHSAAGRALHYGKEVSEKEPGEVKAFVEYFYDHVYKDYCEGERGILRSRINRFKDGCEAYYIETYVPKRSSEAAEVGGTGEATETIEAATTEDEQILAGADAVTNV
jgi:CRISPR type I-D/CYANO-associated protein Csc3/Cas10d